MKTLRHPILLGSLLAAACAGSDSLTTALTATTTDALLQTAQCSKEGFDAAAQACFDAFDTCKAAANADLEACRTTLHACLPPPPQRPQGLPGEGGGGNCGPGGRGGHGDGGVGDGDGDHHGGGDHGGRGPGGPGGPPPGGPDGGVRPEGGGRGNRPLPENAEVQACHDALATCLAATGADEAACRATEHDCVHAAFAAAFQAECDAAATTCASSSSADCARVTARCAQGIDGPRGADGGTACAN